MQIGAQLFTLREFTRDLNAFSETLKKVADIGYRTVQISGTCEYSPEWLAKELEKNGLTCALTHFNPEKIRTEPDKTVEVHRKFGCKYIGIGCIPGGIAGFENVDNFIDDYLPAAKRISESGCYFMYHNHHFEFMHDADGP